MNLSVQELIDKELSKDSPKTHKRSGKWSPSQFGKCYRAQWWYRKNEPQSEVLEPRVLRVFKAGDLFHDFVQNILISHDPTYQKEVLVENGIVKGYADLVNDTEVADIKSQHSKSFWYMDKSANIREDKKPNWLQVMWYAITLGKKYGRLVFVSKDDLCIQEYRQEIDAYWQGEVTNEIATLEYHWASGLPPAKPRAYNGKECKFCPYKTKCFTIETDNNRELPYKEKK